MNLQRPALRRKGLFVVLVLGCAGLAMVLAQTVINASEFGRVGFSGNPSTNMGQTCTACHSLGASLPTVTIAGPQAVVAGSTNLYTLTISGGPAVKGGFNLSTEPGAGVLAPSSNDTQLINGELTHTVPKPFVGGSVSFEFLWTAPAWDDTVTLYGAGNSTNGDDELGGDGSRTTTLDVYVTGGSGTPPPSPTPPPGRVDASATWKTVASGFEYPADIQNAGDERLFVVEQNGRIRIVQPDGSVLPVPFLDIAGRVYGAAYSSETGLLGLAFHPNYAVNGHFYVFYTVQVAGALRSRVSRFTVSAAPDVADPGSELRILEIPQPNPYHIGGQVAFGPDGMLYVSAGDGGPQGDPENRAQNLASLHGKLLRIDVTGSGGLQPECDASGQGNYRIPAGNPYVGKTGCDELWQVGLRNPWRFGFDPATGDLWMADVGWNQREEVDWAPNGSGSGINWGWRCREGSLDGNLAGCGPLDTYTDPVWEYAHQAGRCSITGGYVYRGEAWPLIRGHYFFADFCTSEFWSVRDPDDALEQLNWRVTADGTNPSTFGFDSVGELYVALRSNGTIARLENPVLVPMGNLVWLPVIFR